MQRRQYMRAERVMALGALQFPQTSNPDPLKMDHMVKIKLTNKVSKFL